MSDWRVIHADVREGLAQLPAGSVQVCVTSPPYWGLRSYNTDPQVWGGDPVCEHQWGLLLPGDTRGGSGPRAKEAYRGDDKTLYARGEAHGQLCIACGAWRGELGREPTPQLFVDHLVEVFAGVWRVLRLDGVLFVNLADSYIGSGKGPSNSLQRPTSSKHDVQLEAGTVPVVWEPIPAGMKPKDKALVPERFAISMQEAGWWVRARVAWCKVAPMPESVRDRPSVAWEPILIFTKSRRYYWDQDAVREPSVAEGRKWVHGVREDVDHKGGNQGSRAEWAHPAGGRNQWDYWEVAEEEPDPRDEAWRLGPEGFKGEHYATYPTEIPRRAIVSASSERGCCPTCAAPWRRIVDRQRLLDGEPIDDGKWADSEEPRRMPSNGISHMRYTTARTEGGWEPTCECSPREPGPCVVLDPFCGTGTSGVAALRLGRSFIGIELSAQSVALANQRIAGDCPLFNGVGA